MINRSDYKIVFHSKSERLHYGDFCDYAEFTEILDKDNIIGSFREETGEACFKNDYISCFDPETNTVNRIKVLVIENDRLVLCDLYFKRIYELKEIKD